MKRIIALAAVCLLPACAAPGLRAEYGEPAAPVEHFDDLDSAVLSHPGATVSVVTQLKTGAEGPVSGTRQDQVVFLGTLVPPTHEYLLLLHRSGDTLHIGKGNVVGMYLATDRHSSSTVGAVIGALTLGVGGAVVTGDAGGNLSAGTRLIIVPVAALIGAVVGAAVVPQEDRGEQIYPLRRPRPAGSGGQ